MYAKNMILEADINVGIGLATYNVTYSSSSGQGKVGPEFYYNNRFDLGHSEMFNEETNKMAAIRMGLPNPMTVVTEYMDMNSSPWCTSKMGY